MFDNEAGRLRIIELNCMKGDDVMAFIIGGILLVMLGIGSIMTGVNKLNQHDDEE